MGLRSSKSSSKRNLSNKNKIQRKSGDKSDEQQEDYEVENPNKYDQAAIKSLERDLAENTEMFVLNLLLMSVMFFEDFQGEMRSLANTAAQKGKLNSKLIHDHQKQILEPDAVTDRVDKRVKFQTHKGNLESLVPQRMFILHDIIEIVYKEDTVDYAGIDKPSYHAIIEESKRNKGFAHVNLLGNLNWNLRKTSIDSACSTTPTKLDERKEEANSPTPPTDETPGTSNDSGVNSESDYDYSRITFARTPKRLKISEKDIYSRIGQLPSKCIRPVKVKNEILDSESETDDEDEDESKERNRRFKKKKLQQAQSLFITRYYLNSKEFMKHFKNNVFPNHLGEVLGFSATSIEQATYIPGAIYCDKKGDSIDEAKTYEVVPAIAMPWPEAVAFEWLLRRRVTVRDRRTQISYKWPTENMIKEVKRLNCVVTPKGFMPKKGENTEMEVEWEVGFPKAERYLEIRMTHEQIRIFLYLITLFKTFIEPKTQKRGLLIEHIRILMFWECETNYKTWPEDKLGVKLKYLLQKLYDHLSVQQLPHYFIRSKNVLKNIPGCECRRAQDSIHEIIEAPVLHLLSALKRLKYSSGKFYPDLNFNELYDILTSDEALKRANPGMLFTINIQQQANSLSGKKSVKKKNQRLDKEQEWNKRYHEQQKLKKIKEINRRMELENLNDEQNNNNESIDLSLPLKDFKNNVFRQALLLEFFIDHFIKIAKRSRKLCATAQTARFYLKQSSYLAKLLEASDIEKARKYQKNIAEELDKCDKRTVAKEDPVPFTPKRNSTQQVMHSPEILQVKSKEINILNLTKSYNANAAVNEQTRMSNTEEEVVAEIHSLGGKKVSKSGDAVHEGSSSEDKEVKKAVSFRSQRENAAEIVEDDLGNTNL